MISKIQERWSLKLDRRAQFVEQVREDQSVYGGLMSIVMLMNHVGWLVKKGLIDIEVIAETMRLVVVRTYENTKPIFDEYGRRTGSIQRNRNLVYLYDEMHKFLDDHPELAT
jgi:hypothetical protein